MMDLRENGVVYGVHVVPGSMVKWFGPQPGSDGHLPDPGQSVAWATFDGDCFGTVTERGTEEHGGHIYPCATITVDRVEPRG